MKCANACAAIRFASLPDGRGGDAAPDSFGCGAGACRHILMSPHLEVLFRAQGRPSA